MIFLRGQEICRLKKCVMFVCLCHISPTGGSRTVSFCPCSSVCVSPRTVPDCCGIGFVMCGGMDPLFVCVLCVSCSAMHGVRVCVCVHVRCCLLCASLTVA